MSPRGVGSDCQRHETMMCLSQLIRKWKRKVYSLLWTLTASALNWLHRSCKLASLNVSKGVSYISELYMWTQFILRMFLCCCTRLVPNCIHEHNSENVSMLPLYMYKFILFEYNWNSTHALMHWNPTYSPWPCFITFGAPHSYKLCLYSTYVFLFVYNYSY